MRNWNDVSTVVEHKIRLCEPQHQCLPATRYQPSRPITSWTPSVYGIDDEGQNSPSLLVMFWRLWTQLLLRMGQNFLGAARFWWYAIAVVRKLRVDYRRPIPPREFFNGQLPYSQATLVTKKWRHREFSARPRGMFRQGNLDMNWLIHLNYPASAFFILFTISREIFLSDRIISASSAKQSLRFVQKHFCRMAVT